MLRHSRYSFTIFLLVTAFLIFFIMAFVSPDRVGEPDALLRSSWSATAHARLEDFVGIYPANFQVLWEGATSLSRKSKGELPRYIPR